MGASYVVPAFSGSCINCGYALPRLREISATYFETGTVQCVHCRLAQDIWPSTPVWLAASLGFPGVLATLAFLQVVDLELQVGQIIEISFAGYLPTGAALLSVEYQPSTDCLPIEIPVRRSRGQVSANVKLIGVPLGDVRAGSNPTAHLIWVPREDYTDGWPYMMRALEAAYSRKFLDAMFLAHSAVQISCGAVKSAIGRHRNDTQYLEKLIFPKANRTGARKKPNPSPVKFARLPEAIRLEWDRLDSIRGKLVHRGEYDGISADAIPESNASSLVRAALFVFEYLRYVRSHFI